MANIVVFHSALGLRDSVKRWAERLRELGHQVYTPDLFDGEVFDVLSDGVAKRDALGIPALIGRSQAAVAQLPQELIYTGFSMGAASAQMLAGTRPGARGAVLMHAALPLQMLQIPTWPDDVPVQLHFAIEDPWVESAVVDSLEVALGEHMTVHRYPGSAHLFGDEDSSDYDADAATAMYERAETFIASTATY